jgi:hypothetical protein
MDLTVWEQGQEVEGRPTAEARTATQKLFLFMEHDVEEIILQAADGIVSRSL